MKGQPSTSRWGRISDGCNAIGITVYSDSYQRTARYSGAGAILIGVSGLLGWIFRISALTSIIPGLKPIAISASIVFIFLGSVLFLAAADLCHPRRQRVLMGVALFTTLFGLLEIIHLITGTPVSLEDAILRII